MRNLQETWACRSSRPVTSRVQATLWEGVLSWATANLQNAMPVAQVGKLRSLKRATYKIVATFEVKIGVTALRKEGRPPWYL